MIEIERKFLVKSDAWESSIESTHLIRQGYISGSESHASVRVRLIDDRGVLTLKQKRGDMTGLERYELEYEIPQYDAVFMLDNYCGDWKVKKVRHIVPHAYHVWEVDVFMGDNQGLVTAEIELSSLNERFKKPDWVGEEVTGQDKYTNGTLAQHPYRKWSSS